ncbi:MAG: hypothetical protein OXG07_13020 [Anaerolineaceae bacterium]|nr:hypothetical protein [Anaerolineaceae bacterium]
MIRLTVLYNLPPGSDEEEFLRWRLGEHQESNASRPGVLRTDFGQVTESPLPGQGRAPNALPFRFMTVAEYDTREEFEHSFYDEGRQAILAEDVKRISDAVFLVTEILTETDNRDGTP